MAAIAPAVMPLIGGAATSTFGPIVGSLITTGLGSVVSMKQQSDANKVARRDANQRLAEIERRRVVEERNKRATLKREQARQRARFGASGLLGGGSADAVLDTLRKETERSIADRRAMDQFRISGINQNLADARQERNRGAQAAIQRNLAGVTRSLLNNTTFGEGE